MAYGFIDVRIWFGHLLEAGVNPRLIQRYLGHTQLATTMIYLHLTQTGHEDAYVRINSLMQGLLP